MRGPPPSTAPKGPERRLALIIGNNYKNAAAQSDQRCAARRRHAEEPGFEVIPREPNLRDFKAVMRQFASRMENEDGAALLYYAGHGVQIRGRNFLLPVDVSTGDE
jgi:uncharacterized caspase-like protein